jgi:putative DNA methylase
VRLIETERFPFEFLSQVGERESWRKEVHRPIYHVHKWWAKRLGSVFRGILLGCLLSPDEDLEAAFYERRNYGGTSVFEPFLGSGTTVGEAHKLGLTALGRDINPVAVEAVRTALGPMDRHRLNAAFTALSGTVGERIRSLYRSSDGSGRPCDVLYYFWALQAACPDCDGQVDLLPSYVIARNAYPDRKPEVQILCPNCGDIFPGLISDTRAGCRSCGLTFDPRTGPVSGATATCTHCAARFRVADTLGSTGRRPDFRLYGKLVLTQDETKEYLPATEDDHEAYRTCGRVLCDELRAGSITLPALALKDGYNTRQAMNYGFRSWRDFFNDRQLLALSWLRSAIDVLPDPDARSAMLTLFSGALEFNNMFASYKGEGTGAVRHMFAHHILKPERAPIEANLWGTPKSSGAFSGLFRSRLLRACAYREAPAEVGGNGTTAPPFSGRVEAQWPGEGGFADRGIYLSCGDSAASGLPDRSVDLVVTDPPFFDNVHYSELADFFYAWQQLGRDGGDEARTTRSAGEVQDGDAACFTAKLAAVLRECHRVLRDDGLLAFTYHHSRGDGWQAVAEAILRAGFVTVASQPVKSEMSGATPKSQANEPIQLDIVIVCRKREWPEGTKAPSKDEAMASAQEKMQRLAKAGFNLSRNDRRIVVYGQLLTSFRNIEDAASISVLVEETVSAH